MANLWGTLVMSALLNFLSLRGVFGSFDEAIFGVVLIGIMLLAPDGFLRMSVLRSIRRYAQELLRNRSHLFSYLMFHKRGDEAVNPLKKNGTKEIE